MRKSTTKSLLAYPGAKNLLARKYEPFYPPHRLFISPFGGSGAEIMRKRPSPIEVWNDTDDRLYDMFSLLQDDCEYAQLVELVKRTRNSREQYLECRRILDEPLKKHPRVPGVWAFLVCATIGYRGPHPMRVRSWSSHATSRRRLRDLPLTLRAWRRRFGTVRLEHADWYTVFRKYDSPSTFWFFDPPYHPGSLRGGGLYSHLLTIREHERLLQILLTAKGYVLLCGYEHPLYTSYLFHWRRISFRTRAIMGTGTRRREVIWLNYDANDHKLGGDKLLIAKRFVDITGGVASAQRYLTRIGRLLGLRVKQRLNRPTRHSRRTWTAIDDDGSAIADTRLHMAKHYVEMMGSVEAAQRYLDRVKRLVELFR